MMKLTDDEIAYLLKQPQVRDMLARFNRIKAARHQTLVDDAVDLLARERQFRQAR